MEHLKIVGDFDWTPIVQNIGELLYDQIRGNASYSFTFDNSWLQKFKNVLLSGDLQNFPGPQHKTKSLFAILSDALPDRWGRRLIEKRERILADRENRSAKALNDFDLLIALDDFSRIGGLRFKKGDSYVGVDFQSPVPPLAKLREFIHAAHEYEKSEQSGKATKDEWIFNLFRQGSSLGGARPKANVIDENGDLCIAKIPSVSDDYDVALWEHFAHCMARECKINSAETRLLKLQGIKHHILLSKRFDRNGKKRIHFASAMTLTNLKDGCDAFTGNGYLDIVDSIIGETGVSNPDKTLKELYRRIAFNIAIGNHDDHFRNHGFLLCREGWKFSPAYDLNPTNNNTQSLLISSDSNESSLNILFKAHSEYMLSRTEAESIIGEIREAMKTWRAIATKCGISKSEQERFAKRFECGN